MKRIVVVVMAIASAWPMYGQEYVLLRSELYSTTVSMEGGGYVLQLKESGVVDKSESTDGTFVLDRDPFVYKDFEPPSQPIGLMGATLNTGTIQLLFPSATDNIRVIGYNIFRDGQKVGFSPDDGYLDSGLTAMTTYHYRVEAVDKSWNVSEASESAAVTTMDRTTQDSPPRFVNGPSVRYVGANAAVIGYRTNKATQATVEYGNLPSYGSSVTVNVYAEEQAVSVTGLAPGQRYYYRVSASDYGQHGTVSSAGDSFYTAWGTDATAPVFVQAPSASYVSDTLASISFVTDEDARGFVLYGRYSVHEGREDEAYYGMEHAVTLTGLRPNTVYSYEVSVMDRDGNGPATSVIGTFTTAGAPDRKAPVILKKPVEGYLGDRMAIITWETDEPSDSVVRFGPKHDPTGRQAVSQGMTRSHAVMLQNLEPHGQYSFVAQSTDASGNTGEESKEKLFTTAKFAGDKGPKFKKVEMAATADSATVRWETDEMAESKVVYGEASQAYTGQKYEAKYRVEHEMRLSGLRPGTTYYFQILAKDPSGNETQTQEYTLRTANR